ncbi:MAG: hypothetical protein CVT70_08295 [Alphaproteobacteria bacterium HGW-Alphaproteobacteria-1]|nr:MAG: hypothetical protein CVT70_08295 [Alphaproteobacteria bacterium HGW-Alphaproteobacteria-1]
MIREDTDHDPSFPFYRDPERARPRGRHQPPPPPVASSRYDYNTVRPHSSPGNKAAPDARRALEQSEGFAPSALARPRPTPRTLVMNEGRPGGRSPPDSVPR